jgi:tRNA pseudouridine55 synthase
VTGVPLGFILVDKPPGPTSHDVVANVRRALGIKRVGHAGTLDPPASGLLVVAVGPATRLVRFVQQQEKTYECRGVLGVTTSTLDAAGEVVERREVAIDPAAVSEAAAAFAGEIEQVPPAVSALKVGGERAYKRAARGETVELEPRRVVIHDIEVTSVDLPSFQMRVRCSTGTYIRSLVADIGDRLGAGAHVQSLRRTAIGSLSVADAIELDAITPEAVRGVADVLADLPHVEVDADDAVRARNGVKLPADIDDGDVLLIGPSGAIGVFNAKDGILRPVTVLGTS